MNQVKEFCMIKTDTDRLSHMEKEAYVLAQHPFKITKLSTSGRYNTYIKFRGKRINIKTVTYEQMIDKLFEHYFGDTPFDNQTLKELFDEWLEYKTAITESPNTIRRHIQHYNKYFKGTDIFKKRVKDVKGLELNKFCNALVKRYDLSSKEWVNVKTILKGMFEYAVANEYISSSPLDKVKISVKFRQVNRKYGSTETFNSEELDVLNAYLDRMFEDTEDASFMAVRVNLYLGLRVGELVSLRWSDIEGNYLHVCREEIRNQETGEYSVVNHTKTGQDRYVAIVPTAQRIFDSLYAGIDGYIFIRNGERLTSRAINYVLEKFAERTGMKVKSSHKLRKTYASRLQASGVPIDEISHQLGHSNLETTMKYIFNPLTEKETYNRIVDALN